ncbi:MAG TPA: hypothetical protein DDW65_16165 [Firmicutes bacterium]|jgi:hypothetical protein|nr:hypothetical protein [Bacillota bacterium]
MIEIDDAGGGCFIGPEVLVIHKLETGKVWYLNIPPTVQERIQYAARILKAAFRDLAVSREEPVRLCRGEIFDLFQEYLMSQGYRVVREKVSDATDQLAEARFMDILYSYGFPRNLTLKDRNYQEFYQLVSCWYHYCKEEDNRLKGIRKTRLQPSFYGRKVARKYPNLLRKMLEEEAIS